MKVFYTIIFLSIVFSAASQDSVSNKYGLKVISSSAAYKKSIVQKPGLAMTDIKAAIPDIELDLRYAGSNNFTRRQLYPATKTTYLRRNAVMALKLAQLELKTKGLGLKIFDAYRPYSATEAMWKLVKDERYAADPKKGSGHNRAVAVDLTIIDLTTKKELDMGTAFDNFTDSAHHDFKDLPAPVLQNRSMLKQTMENAGFNALETEWWHYSLPNVNEYDLLNLSFDQL
ncbi:MAG: M15 family metallopeptidase [Chitinophagaceae bacterium]|nr:M15 family metallopeptidase [Chitinophagaceae bacterium]